MSGSWSGGTGSFNPNASTLNAVYTPSAAEMAAGSVTLTLTTNDPAGSCGPANDQMKITINPNPTVEISLADACLSTAHLHATVTGGVTPYTFTWKKNGVAVTNNSADLALTGPGTYTVSVVDDAAAATPTRCRLLHRGLRCGIHHRRSKRSERRTEAEIRILGTAGSDGAVVLFNGGRREVFRSRGFR